MPDTPTATKPRPKYEAEKVDELPENYSRRSGPRPDPAFLEAVKAAHGDAGEWYCVATFPSATGAKNKATELVKASEEGNSLLPEGEWDIEYRAVQAPENDESGQPKKWSKLYLRFDG